jgi:hypothetical protein
MPLEVMLTNMHFYHNHSEQFFADLGKLMADRHATPDQLLRVMDKFLACRANAQKCAVDAAPYVHPKLSAVRVEAQPDAKQLADTELLGALTAVREQIMSDAEPEPELSEAAE